MTTRAGDPAWSAREIEHTADVGFEIEAPGWEALLERAGLVVAALIVSLDGVSARQTVRIDVTAASREELLHDWLQAILVRVQAGFVPCELCWFQRICMYPLSIVTLLAALANDRRVARYLLPLPLVGAGISVYHLLVENGVVKQTQACLISAPGGCATKWIEEFGYVTIPVLALTGFALCFAFLLLSALPPPSAATVSER